MPITHAACRADRQSPLFLVRIRRSAEAPVGQIFHITPPFRLRPFAAGGLELFVERKPLFPVAIVAQRPPPITSGTCLVVPCDSFLQFPENEGPCQGLEQKPDPAEPPGARADDVGSAAQAVPEGRNGHEVAFAPGLESGEIVFLHRFPLFRPQGQPRLLCRT